MPEKHDRNECRQFPEKGHVCVREHRIDAVHISGRNRKSDEGHHAGKPCTKLPPRAREEHEPAVEEHDRTEREGKIAGTRERGWHPPEHCLRKLGIENNRNGEYETHPKLPQERRGGMPRVPLPLFCLSVCAPCFYERHTALGAHAGRALLYFWM